MADWKFISAVVVALCCCVWLPQALSAGGSLPPPPLCAGSGGMPVMLGEALSFCGNAGLSCCNEADDAALRGEFLAMNTTTESDAACAKATLCQKCDPPLLSTSPTNNPPLCGPTRPPPPSSASRAATAGPVCVDRIASGSFVNMAAPAHPDGSNQVFLSTQDGTIRLASPGSGGYAVAPAPFLDLTDRVLHDSVGVLGLKGVAFHPDFALNGRFFVSYTCDSASPACGIGACGPEELAAGASGGYRPCQYNLVVAEFFAATRGGMGSEVGVRAETSEVRRIFTMGLPQQPYTPNSHHQQDGQILFRPRSDGYLYLVTGNGGDKAHGQFDFSENERSFLGKILRFDVDGIAGAVSEPEIVAMGLGNPRGCSYDSERPSNLYCAGLDQQQNQQVYLISDENPVGHMEKAVVISHGPLAAGEMPSIIGGFVYRGTADPMLNGRYLYMHGFAVRASMEGPAVSSGHYGSDRIPSMMCSRNTPLRCTRDIGSLVLSLAEDNSNDAFFLATDGLYHVVSHGLCGGGAPPQPFLSTTKGITLLSAGGGTAVTIVLYLVSKLLGGDCSLNINRVGTVINNYCGHGR